MNPSNRLSSSMSASTSSKRNAERMNGVCSVDFRNESERDGYESESERDSPDDRMDSSGRDDQERRPIITTTVQPSPEKKQCRTHEKCIFVFIFLFCALCGCAFHIILPISVQYDVLGIYSDPFYMTQPMGEPPYLLLKLIHGLRPHYYGHNHDDELLIGASEVEKKDENGKVIPKKDMNGNIVSGEPNAAAVPVKTIVWLIGDSFLDNKSFVMNGGMSGLQEPLPKYKNAGISIMVQDVAYWISALLEYGFQDLPKKTYIPGTVPWPPSVVKGNKLPENAVALNAAVAGSLASTREDIMSIYEKNRLEDWKKIWAEDWHKSINQPFVVDAQMDSIVQQHITTDDVAILSISANDEFSNQGDPRMQLLNAHSWEDVQKRIDMRCDEKLRWMNFLFKEKRPKLILLPTYYFYAQWTGFFQVYPFMKTHFRENNIELSDTIDKREKAEAAAQGKPDPDADPDAAGKPRDHEVYSDQKNPLFRLWEKFHDCHKRIASEWEGSYKNVPGWSHTKVKPLPTHRLTQFGGAGIDWKNKSGGDLELQGIHATSAGALKLAVMYVNAMNGMNEGI